MHISIRKYKLTSQDPKTRGELTRQINDLFLPQISKAPGFVSYYAVDAGSGAVVGIDRFGESAPAGELFKYFGFTIENVVKTVKGVL